MELERRYEARFERQEEMPELPQKTIRIQQIELLDHLFNYHGLSHADERAAVLLRNWMAVDHSRLCDLYSACVIADAIPIQTIKYTKTLR